MDFHTFLLGLPRDKRDDFGRRCGSTAGRLMQIAYGNEPASAELCTAIDRESAGVVCYRDVNKAWVAKRGADDTRKRIPMDWDYIEQKVGSGKPDVATTAGAAEDA